MSLLQNIKRGLFNNYWEIGFVQTLNPIGIEYADIKWVKRNYKDGWFADPFILDITDTEIILLVEEFYYKTKLGRISKITINKDTYTIINVKPILELPTHLSFPAILRYNGEVYIYPENSKSGSLNLYRLSDNGNRCELVTELVHEPLTDAIMFDIDDKHYIMATKIPDPNGRVVSLYGSEEKLGKYSLIKEIELSDNTARNGGCILNVDDKLVKVSQECNDFYGKGLVFYEFNTKTFSFLKIKTFYPKGNKVVGIHTLNKFEKNTYVLDGKIFNHSILVPVLKKIKNFIKNK